MEIQGLGLRAGHMGHARDWAVGETRLWGEPRGPKVVGSNVRCEKKSGWSLERGRRIVTILMFDELAIEKRPRWDDKSNKFLGMCHEHGHVTSLEFTSKDDLVIL